MPLPIIAGLALKAVGKALKKKLAKKASPPPPPPQLPTVPTQLSNLAQLGSLSGGGGLGFDTRQLPLVQRLERQRAMPGGGFTTGRGFGGEVVPFRGGPSTTIRVSPTGRRIRVSAVTGKAIRRINPANGKAAIRAVRRVAATHKLLKKVEKAMRKAGGASGRRAVYAPAPQVRHFARRK